MNGNSSNLWTMTALLGALSFLPGGCLVGCIPSTTQLAGFTQASPAIEAEWGWFKKSVTIGTNFTGHASMTRDDETGEIQTFSVEINSDAGAIYDAQGRRVITSDLAGLRRDNYAFQIEAVREIGAIANSLADKAVTVLTAGIARNDSSMIQAAMALLDKLSPVVEQLELPAAPLPVTPPATGPPGGADPAGEDGA